MTRRKRIKKTKKEIDIENQIKILEQQLAIERSKNQNQSIIKKPAREILKNDYRDVISAEIPGIIEEGKPDYEKISDTLKNNFHDVILRYKVKNFKSNNIESYLNKISKWVKRRVITGWKKKFKKFKLQINPVFLFYNPITREENQIHRYTNPQIILTSDDFEEYIENLKSKFTSIIDDMQQRGSQWIFIKIISSNIFLYNVTDESAKSYIKSPFSSQSILNIQNDDNYCFLYSILAYFYYDIEKNT